MCLLDRAGGGVQLQGTRLLLDGLNIVNKVSGHMITIPCDDRYMT